MKFKLPKISVKNSLSRLSLPKINKNQENLTSLIDNGKFNTSGIFNDIKSRVPSPLQKMIPGIKEKLPSMDVGKMVSDNALDVDGMLSKSNDVNDIMNEIKISYDVDTGKNIKDLDLPKEIDLSYLIF